MVMGVENASGLEVHPEADVVTLINVFTPKPGMLDAFCEAQIAEYRRLSGQVEGSLGSNLHRSLDGRFAANYTQFSTEALYRQWVDGNLFANHLKIIGPLVEKVEPKLFKVVYTQSVTEQPDGDRQISENGVGAVVRLGNPVLTLINRFTPKPGMIDAFCEAQIAEYRRLAPLTSGIVTANLHRALDGSMAANYAQFRSKEDYRSWIEGPLFPPHLAVIRPYVERADPILFELVYTLHEPGARLAPETVGAETSA